jgi:hypothetical protein
VLVATCAEDFTCRLWDVSGSSGAQLAVLKVRWRVCGVRWGPGGAGWRARDVRAVQCKARGAREKACSSGRHRCVRLLCMMRLCTCRRRPGRVAGAAASGAAASCRTRAGWWGRPQAPRC